MMGAYLRMEYSHGFYDVLAIMPQRQSLFKFLCPCFFSSSEEPTQQRFLVGRHVRQIPASETAFQYKDEGK
jgi:hypothetical protein